MRLPAQPQARLLRVQVRCLPGHPHRMHAAGLYNQHVRRNSGSAMAANYVSSSIVTHRCSWMRQSGKPFYPHMKGTQQSSVTIAKSGPALIDSDRGSQPDAGLADQVCLKIAPSEHYRHSGLLQGHPCDSSELSDENRCQLVDDASNICLVHNGILQQGARWLNLELLVIVSCVTSMCFLTQYKSPCPRISGEAPAHPVQAAGAV